MKRWHENKFRTKANTKFIFFFFESSFLFSLSVCCVYVSCKLVRFVFFCVETWSTCTHNNLRRMMSMGMDRCWLFYDLTRWILMEGEEINAVRTATTKDALSAFSPFYVHISIACALNLNRHANILCKTIVLKLSFFLSPFKCLFLSFKMASDTRTIGFQARERREKVLEVLLPSTSFSSGFSEVKCETSRTRESHKTWR